jgi:hypothetical protein
MPSINLAYLMRQRQAVERAILRAKDVHLDDDAELLQSVVVLIDDLTQLVSEFNAAAARRRQRHN